MNCTLSKVVHVLNSEKSITQWTYDKSSPSVKKFFVESMFNKNDLYITKWFMSRCQSDGYDFYRKGG